MAKKKSLKLLKESALRKKYEDTSSLGSDLVLDDHIWLPSRNVSLNYQLGGGTPYGKIMELFGYESTGKTLLAMDFASNAQKLGGIVLWDDAENAFDPGWAVQNGMNLDQLELYEENDIEGMSDWVRDMIIFHRSQLQANEPILFVIDSLAALDCEDNIGADALNAKAQMGNRAKAIYRMYRERNSIFKRYGVVVIAINQIRDKVGASMFEASTTTPGGQATKFYASQRLALIRSKQIKGRIVKGAFKEDLKKGHKVGQNIIQAVEKNKCAPPRPRVKTAVYFLDEKTDYVGFDRYQGLDIILQEQGIIKKKGTRYLFKDEVICNGKKNILPAIEENGKLRKRLFKKLGVNTMSKTRQKLEGIDINRYPVKLKKGDDEE